MITTTIQLAYRPLCRAMRFRSIPKRDDLQPFAEPVQPPIEVPEAGAQTSAWKVADEAIASNAPHKPSAIPTGEPRRRDA